MERTALITPLDHDVLRGVETLPVGSAKVPRLPCLPALVEAADAETLASVLVAERERLEAYADALAGDGLGDMARTLRLVVTHVDHLGGCGGELGRRDVELRTYAFPVLPA